MVETINVFHKIFITLDQLRSIKPVLGDWQMSDRRCRKD